MARRSSPEPVPLLYAHRGCTLRRRENTRAAFDDALLCGFRAFELDLIRLADDNVVVFHDFSLVRQFGKLARLGRITLSQFKKINKELLTFDEFTERYSGKDITVNFEIKDDPRTLALMTSGMRKFKRPVVSSFRKKVVDAAIDAGFTGGYLFDNLRAFARHRHSLKSKRLHISRKMLLPKKPHPFHGYELHVYTVNDPAEAFRIASFSNVKGMFTDTPAFLPFFPQK